MGFIAETAPNGDIYFAAENWGTKIIPAGGLWRLTEGAPQQPAWLQTARDVAVDDANVVYILRNEGEIWRYDGETETLVVDLGKDSSGGTQDEETPICDGETYGENCGETGDGEFYPETDWETGDEETYTATSEETGYEETYSEEGESGCSEEDGCQSGTTRLTDLEWSPDGYLYALAKNAIYRIHPGGTFQRQNTLEILDNPEYAGLESSAWGVVLYSNGFYRVNTDLSLTSYGYYAHPFFTLSNDGVLCYGGDGTRCIELDTDFYESLPDMPDGLRYDTPYWGRDDELLVYTHDNIYRVVDAQTATALITNSATPTSGTLRITGQLPNQGPWSVAYQRDKLGRITEKTEIIEGIRTDYQYTYDLAGRLASVAQDGVTTSTYTYDANGNRLAHNETLATHDAQDRLLTYGDTRYTYTANGELQTQTDASGTTHYHYDLLGNLIQVTLPNGTQIDYLIDGQNRRIGKKINGVLTQGLLYQDQLNPPHPLRPPDGMLEILEAVWQIKAVARASRFEANFFKIRGESWFYLTKILEKSGQIRVDLGRL